MSRMSSGYFRDRFQGVGAIAAFAPAPRSAPAPSVRAPSRMGGQCFPGCVPYRDANGNIQCDCDLVTGGVMQRQRLRARAGDSRYAGLGATLVDGEDVGGAGGGTVSGKGGLRQIFTGVMAPSISPTPTKSPIAPTLSPSSTTTSPTPPGYLPPRIPTKTQTASYGSGGAAWTGSPSSSGGGMTLETLAPPENEQALPGSAMPGGLPGGAAKIWLVLGLGGVGYLAYRHFKKKRRRR